MSLFVKDAGYRNQSRINVHFKKVGPMSNMAESRHNVEETLGE